MIKLRDLDNRFQADVWTAALNEAGVPHLLRTYQDTAYDGLWVSQKGFGTIMVEEPFIEAARQVDAELSAPGGPGQQAGPGLAQSMDHTLLKPQATLADLDRLLAQCREYGFAAACVCPWMVPHAARGLAGSGVAVCTVVDFPLGMTSAGAKLAEAVDLAKLGAVELDVVINRGLIFSGRLEQAVEEIRAIALAVAPAEVKVILETSQLGPELSAQTAAALAHSGAAWLKTGTGHFGPATVEDVRILAQAAPELGVKAAGGIRTLAEALSMLEAGAERLGTSSADAIMIEAAGR